MDVREKLVELVNNARMNALWHNAQKPDEYITDMLIEDGVTVQDDMKELIGKGLDNIYWRIYGSNKEFNERMAGYTPSAFCAGFEYAIQLAKGLLTQLPQPPKGE